MYSLVNRNEPDQTAHVQSGLVLPHSHLCLVDIFQCSAKLLALLEKLCDQSKYHFDLDVHFESNMRFLAIHEAIKLYLSLN